jgi:AraC-like DNA-binding protein
MPNRDALPPLAFGNDIAIVHENAQEFTDLIERAFPGMNAYDPLTPKASFRSKSAVLELPHAKVVATAISPTHIDRSKNEKLTFMVPFASASESLAQVGDRKIWWGRGTGVFLPQTDERVIGTGGFRSHLMWQLEKELLERTAKAMLGTQERVDLDLTRARVLPGEIAGVRTDASMCAVLPLLELHRMQPEMLANLGVQDVIYRQSVMLLRPDLFLGMPSQTAVPPDPPISHSVLGPLCEYIMAHLCEPLSLTDLESMSGMSARALQLAFRAVHGCSPMTWIKEQRLLRVRADLLKRVDAPIEALALAAGFQTMPAFFLAYKKRFGETPGATRVPPQRPNNSRP